MSSFTHRPNLAGLALALYVLSPAPAHAQSTRPGFTKTILQHPITLAALAEVQTDLKLTDEQKKKVDELGAKLADGRQSVFGAFNGDWDQFRKDMNKLSAEMQAELNRGLDEAQQKRLQEIYVQVNGMNALQDESIVKVLGLTAAQATKLAEAVNAARERNFAAFQEMQGMSPENREKKIDELVKLRDEAYAAALTDDQKAAFEKLKGATLEIDLSRIPNPFGG